MKGAAAIAFVAIVAYVALGLAVSHVPPHGIDGAGAALAGEAPRLALVFTASCRWEVLVVWFALALLAAWQIPDLRARLILFAVTIPVMWKVSDAFKEFFGRPRPPYWRLIHETSASYSSGHAMWATIVYWAAASLIWRSTLPRPVRLAAAVLLALWGVGIIWSRLALGAHYVTDLIGGVLLGVFALAAGSALLRRRTAPRAANPSP